MIRPAVLDDCETIVEFNKQLAKETEGKTLLHHQVESGVRALLAHPHHGAYYVAHTAAEVVGQVMHTREWSDWRNGEIWWLQSVFVLPAFRRRGIFRGLLQHIEGVARSTPNVIGLRLYAEEHNSDALKTYEALGLSRAGYLVLEHFFEQKC